MNKKWWLRRSQDRKKRTFGQHLHKIWSRDEGEWHIPAFSSARPQRQTWGGARWEGHLSNEAPVVGEQVVEPGFEPVTLYETHAFSPLPLPTTHFSLMLNMAADLHDPCPCKQGLEEDTRRVQRKCGHRRHRQLLPFSSSFFLKGLPRSFTQDPHSRCMLGQS